MSEAGRIGDRSYVDEDKHSCGACPHRASGPAITGSANVLINGRGALRVDDRGKHSSCCGDESWKAVGGAPRVLINDKLAHRRKDVTKHCGGSGNLITGSANVLIGDYSGESTGKPYVPKIKLRDMPDPLGVPRAFVPWALFRGHQKIEVGRTNAQGDVLIQGVLKMGQVYVLRYPGGKIDIIGGDAPSVDVVKGVKVRLAALGYDPGTLDNLLGLAGRKALRQFQAFHGLPATAELDAKTKAKLSERAGF